MSTRGILTDAIKARSVKLLGYEISVTELRLMPYIMHVMMNDQYIDPTKINTPERRMLSKWREAGHIEGGVSWLTVTKKFWMICSELVWMAYLNYEKEG